MKKLLLSLFLSLYSIFSYGQLEVIGETNINEYKVLKRCLMSALCCIESPDSTYFIACPLQNGDDYVRFYLGDGRKSALNTLHDLMNILETGSHKHIFAVKNRNETLTLEVNNKQKNKKMKHFIGTIGTSRFLLDMYRINKFFDFLSNYKNVNKTDNENITNDDFSENQDHQ